MAEELQGHGDVSDAGRTPAVVVSGTTVGLAVVRALGEAGIPVVLAYYRADDMAQASRYVVATISVPDPIVDETAFVEALVEHAGEFGGAVLIPASDESAHAISHSKDRLDDLYLVASPDGEVTDRFIDKSITYELAVAAGVPAPQTAVPRSEEDLLDAAAAIGYPVLLKPAEGHLFFEHFKRKMFRAEGPSELLELYRPAIEAGLKVMVQEIIPGDERSVVNYNAYFWGGRALAEFTARQLRKAPPRLGSPRVVISEGIPEIVEPGRRILAALGFEGFACTEFKRDSRDGVYKLMEVNGRHNLSGMLALRCGLNFPLMQYEHLTADVVPTGGQFRAGVYWTDLMRDVGYSLAAMREERFKPSEYLEPYTHYHCDAIWDREDPGPFRARVGFLFPGLWTKVRTAVGG